jgi:MOSC domain-containing protein YiiM
MVKAFFAGHGGEHRAIFVFVYQTSAYEFLARWLHRTDFTMQQFGENFAVSSYSLLRREGDGSAAKRLF